MCANIGNIGRCVEHNCARRNAQNSPIPPCLPEDPITVGRPFCMTELPSAVPYLTHMNRYWSYVSNGVRLSSSSNVSLLWLASAAGQDVPHKTSHTSDMTTLGKSRCPKIPGCPRSHEDAAPARRRTRQMPGIQGPPRSRHALCRHQLRAPFGPSRRSRNATGAILILPGRWTGVARVS